MTFQIKALQCFVEQVSRLSPKAKKLVENKIELLKDNPFRFKRLHSEKLQLFRIRLSLDGKESRLVYAVIEPNIILVCILERKNDYKDLKKYLTKLS